MCLQHTLKLNKEIELSCKSLKREFHAVGAEKPKLRFPNLFVRTCGISSWPEMMRRRLLSWKKHMVDSRQICGISETEGSRVTPRHLSKTNDVR